MEIKFATKGQKMKYVIIKFILFFFLLIPITVFSHTLDKRDAEKFAKDLLWHRSSLQSWFDTTDLAESHRLGIVYEGVDYKNLIAYDVDDTVKRMVQNQSLEYSVTVDSLDQDISLVTLIFSTIDQKNQFYFKGKRCISPLAYVTRNWMEIESKHFKFFISDSTLFNAYCIEKLELYVGQMAIRLGMSDKEVQRLQKNKIYYYLCRDEDEIERLTGFRARGMYNLAYDAVITTFPTHYHELTHLLMNYRLQHLPLYTHPFLQEGFAVAYGGRGGTESGVLLSIGNFLYRSETVDLAACLNKKDFEQLDPSLSYPASGLYNRFLIETIGIQSYLKLYRAHSGSAGDNVTVQIASNELPDDSRWQLYIRTSSQNQLITLDSISNHDRVIFEDQFSRVSEDSMQYHFLLFDSLLLPSTITFPTFRSREFSELFPGKIYHGEKYLIRATHEEISVYNLLTNNLIANYVESFTIPPLSVPQSGNRYSFSIKKNVFDEPIGSLLNTNKHGGK